MKKISLHIFLFSASFAFSQDIHFSQFNENPSLINPALTGASGPLRASLTNRTQWRSVTTPYQTMGASFEGRIKAASWSNQESQNFRQNILGRLAGGISVYRDKVGDGNLGQSQVNLSLASYVAINKFSFISLGLQGSIVQRMIDNSKLIFPNQYNGTVYDPNQPSKEEFTNVKFTYFDLGAGAQWTYSSEQMNLAANKQFISHFGFAVYHLSQPKQEYLGTLSKLNMRYVSHGDFIASLGNSQMAIAPSYLLQFQGPSREITAGAMMRHYFNSSSKYTGYVIRDCFGYGLYYRSKDALIFSMLFEKKEKLAIVMSYDLNISSLAPASHFRGGLEVTLKYLVGKNYFYQKNKNTEKE